MFRNNVLNDIEDSGRLNLRYSKQNKGRLRNIKSQEVALNANVDLMTGRDNRYADCEERAEVETIGIHYYFKKSGAGIDTPHPVLRRQANSNMLEGRKYMFEHNGGVTNSDEKAKLLMDISPSFEQVNHQFEDRHNWSQLSTSKICKILEDISGKRYKTRRQRTSLQKKKYSEKVPYKKNSDGNQDWSQIPNEEMCELIEKIASRRNKNLKQRSCSSSQDQKTSDITDLPESGTHRGAIIDSLPPTKTRSSEEKKLYHFDSEDRVPNFILLTHQKNNLKLVPFSQKGRNRFVIVFKDQGVQSDLRELGNELTAVSKCPVNRPFNATVTISSRSFIYCFLQKNIFNNTEHCRKRSVLFLKFEAINSADSPHHTMVVQNTLTVFSTILLRSQFDPKKYIADCYYNSQKLRPIHNSFGTFQKQLRYLPMPFGTTTIKDNYSQDSQPENKTSRKDIILLDEVSSNGCLISNGNNAYYSDSVECSCKPQALENKETPNQDDTIVWGSATHSMNLFASLRGIFHKIYSEGCYKKIDLSETLFYDDSTKRWLKMKDLVHH